MTWQFIAVKQKMQPIKSNARWKIRGCPATGIKDRRTFRWDRYRCFRKGTWVRLLHVPVEGKVVQGFDGLDVGDRVRVQLISVDVQQGFIDFRKMGALKALIRK